MTARLLRISLPFLLLVCAGLYASTLFSFFRPFPTVYPPPGTYKPLPDKPGTRDFRYVEASPGAHYNRNSFSEIFVGKHYRFLWTTPVKVQVLRLDVEKLRIKRKGGGMQTTSFTLKHQDGREFTLRSIDKNPVSVLPAFWHYTMVAAFVRDQISATDPYALPLIARPSQAAGIYHAEPRMVFLVPGDPGFRKYPTVQGFFMMYPKIQPRPGFETPNGKFIRHFSTSAMLRKRRKPGVTVDSLAFLECRLFDLLISDWDRHARQWDWHAFSRRNDTVFIPIPKDRDQAFGYYNDGVLPWIFSRDFAVRKITSFGPEFEDMPGFLQNGSVMDHELLGQIPEEEFVAAARRLQQKITDPEIEAAVRKYPPEVYARIAPRIQNILKIRREKLPEAAVEFYRLLHSSR